jgi:DNA-directed RNA polymerase specialized sigma24 family protein
VWLDIRRGLPRLADPEAFGAWAFRIARDRAFRELRRKGLPNEPIAEVADEPDDFTAAQLAEVQRGRAADG